MKPYSLIPFFRQSDSNPFVEKIHKVIQDVRRWELQAQEFAIMWCMAFLEMDLERAKRHLQLQEQPYDGIPNIYHLSGHDYYFRVVYLPTNTILKELLFTADPIEYVKNGTYKIKMEVTI